MREIRQRLRVAFTFLVTMAAPALAQDDARTKLLIPEVGLATEVGHFPRGAPGTSTGSPIAFGANWGEMYVGAGFEAPTRFTDRTDGAATVGMGFGNAARFLGLDVGLSALSMVEGGVGWGNRMALSGKLHRILPDDWGIAVGASNVYLEWQPPGIKPSYYGVISKVWDLQGSSFAGVQALTFSGGVGNQDFRLERDIRNDNKTVGIFGSLALRMWEQVGVIVDWPGQDLNIGLSLVPIRDFPLVLTPAIVDVTGSAGTYHYATGARRRFSIGAGMVVRF